MAAPGQQRTRILLRYAEKELIYEKSLESPGMALHRLGEWAMTELGLERPLAVSTVAAVLKLQASQRAAHATAAAAAIASTITGFHNDSKLQHMVAATTTTPATTATATRPTRARRSELRMRMTLQEKEELLAKYRATPDMKLRDLGDWAVTQFGLGRPPARSTLSVIIRQTESAPLDADDDGAVDTESTTTHTGTGARPGPSNRDALRKNVFKSESMKVERKLKAWIDACAARGVCVAWSIVRAYASSLRDELLETETDPHVREKLEALQFSKGWLYRFQTDHGLVEHKRSAAGGALSSEWTS